jgi:hypothetical protein
MFSGKMVVPGLRYENLRGNPKAFARSKAADFSIAGKNRKERTVELPAYPEFTAISDDMDESRARPPIACRTG